MTVSGEYERFILDNLKVDLEWLEEEFELLFRDKGPKSKEDIAIGNQILDNLLDNLKVNDSEEVLNLLTITLNRIEQMYPEFF